MKISMTALLAAQVLALFTIGGAHAATPSTSLVSSVIESCPIEERVGKCANAVIDFVSVQPADVRNEQIVGLVAALAEAAQNPAITPYMCAELEEGIRIAGSASTDASARQQIEELANGLCASGRTDTTITGGIGSNGNGGYGNGPDAGDEDNGGDDGHVPPVSVIEQPDDPGTPPPPPPPPSDDGEGEDGDDGEGGGDIIL